MRPSGNWPAGEIGVQERETPSAPPLCVYPLHSTQYSITTVRLANYFSFPFHVKSSGHSRSWFLFFSLQYPGYFFFFFFFLFQLVRKGVQVAGGGLFVVETSQARPSHEQMSVVTSRLTSCLLLLYAIIRADFDDEPRNWSPLNSYKRTSSHILFLFLTHEAPINGCSSSLKSFEFMKKKSGKILLPTTMIQRDFCFAIINSRAALKNESSLR